jgi:hypothetical protein
VLSYLEHEWYDNDFTGGNQPPLPFSYHNWLIDPKHKWEDMSKRMVELPPPVEYAKKFIEDYKIKKLRSTV